MYKSVAMAIKTRTPTSIAQPCPVIVVRAGTYCRNEIAWRAPRVCARCKKVRSNRSSVVRLLFKSPNPSSAARDDNRVLDSRFKSSSRLVHAHCPLYQVGQCCVDSLPEKPGSTGPGPGRTLQAPISFTLVRTSVPASPPLLKESSARMGACSCGIFPGCSQFQISNAYPLGRRRQLRARLVASSSLFNITK
jgi:hypothetical protein